MESSARYLVSMALGFLIGGFPAGVLVSRRRFGIDVRDIGSGNIGATNVTRAFGWRAGALVFVLDYFKGALPIWLLGRSFPLDSWLVCVSGVSLVFGHCYSPYLRFRGGKGVATSFGVASAIIPCAAAVAGTAYMVLLYITKISAIGSLAGVAVLLLSLPIIKPPVEIVILMVAISTLVIIRHRSNISRLVITVRKGRGKNG